jgi:hypothetical protein
MEIFIDCIRDRSHLEPEPVSRHSRNLTQPGISVCACESVVGYICQSADWIAV